MNYEDYFDYHGWWTDALYQVDQFFNTAGPTEMGIMATIVMAVGFLCMRGFQIR